MKNPHQSRGNPRDPLGLSSENLGAYVGMGSGALLLTLGIYRPGQISEVLGLGRQSLDLWMHKVNERGVTSLKLILRPGVLPM
jgi:hypothetical protein